MTKQIFGLQKLNNFFFTWLLLVIDKKKFIFNTYNFKLEFV